MTRARGLLVLAIIIVLACVGLTYAGYHYLVRNDGPQRSSLETAAPSDASKTTSEANARSTTAARPDVIKPARVPAATAESPASVPTTPPRLAKSESTAPPQSAVPRIEVRSTPEVSRPAVAARRSDVRIATSPTGARVFLDGEMRGKSPLTLSDVVWGDHKVRLEKDGYSALEQTVTLDRRGLDLSLDMRPCSGRIVVKTDPPGAAVLIGGIFEGNSPVAKTLKCGRHSLRARMSAREDARQMILVRDGVEEFLLALKRRPGAVRPTPLVPATAAVPSMPSTSPSGPAPSTASAPSTAPAMAAVASVPPPSTATLTLTTSGFEVLSGLPAVLTLGLLTSQYAVELDGKLVVDWRLRTVEMSLQVPPGDHHLRILVRNALVRLGDPVHDARINVSAARPTTVDVKFHLSTVAVNGTERPFTFTSWQNQRRSLE